MLESRPEDALVKLVKTVETVETGFRWQKISVPKKFWPEYFCPNYHPMHLSSKTFLKEKVFRTNIGIVCCNIGYQRLTNSHTAWLPRRGMKEEVKMPEGSQARSRPQRSPDTTCQSIPTQIWGIYISNWLRFEAYTFYMEQLDLSLSPTGEWYQVDPGGQLQRQSLFLYHLFQQHHHRCQEVST